MLGPEYRQTTVDGVSRSIGDAWQGFRASGWIQASRSGVHDRKDGFVFEI